MVIEKIIEDLVELVIVQKREIERLNRKIDQIKQYIEVYEDYIKGE